MDTRTPDTQVEHPRPLELLANIANWGRDRYGRPTIALEHHRVTLYRFGDGWTWACERYDEPGFIRFDIRRWPRIEAAQVAVMTVLGLDIEDGQRARENVYRSLAATVARKQAKRKSVRPWPPEEALQPVSSSTLQSPLPTVPHQPTPAAGAR